MKKAFNLIELIFVILIIGLLVGIGVYSFKPNHQRNDTRMLAMQLQKARYQGINYYQKRFDSGIGCLKPAALSIKNYTFKSRIDPKGFQTICFDYLGRVYLDGQRAKDQVQIELSYRSKTATIQIDPKTGYVIINN